MISNNRMRLKHFNIDLGCQIFSSCADSSRLRILNLIMHNGSMCIRDLERVLSFTQTKTSRHLAYLRNNNILYAQRHYQWVFYHIKTEINEVVEQLFQFMQHDAVLKKDQQIYRDMFSSQQLVNNKLSSTLLADFNAKA